MKPGSSQFGKADVLKPARFRRAWRLFVFGGLLSGGIVATLAAWQRLRVEQAVEECLANAPTMSAYGAANRHVWEIDRDDALEWIKSEAGFFVPKFVAVVEQDKADVRRVNAVKTLQWLLSSRETIDLRRIVLPALLDVLDRSVVSESLEAEIATTTAMWVDRIGIDVARRVHVRDFASRSSAVLRPQWVSALAEIGGREETLLLLKLGDTSDAAVVEAVFRSSLMQRTRWRGILPLVIKKLEDPMAAVHILLMALLRFSDDGRQVLAKYAVDACHPLERRQQAVDGLLDTVAGARLLLARVRDPDLLRSMSECLGPDPEFEIEVRLNEHRLYYGDEFWLELISGLGLDPVPPSWVAMLPPENRRKAIEDATVHQKHTTEACLSLLREFSGRDDLTSEAEWNAWFKSNQPSKIELTELISAVERRPDAIWSGTILRRFVLVRMGEIPTECFAEYRRLAISGPEEIQPWAAEVVLTLSDDLSVIPSCLKLLRRECELQPTGTSWTSSKLRTRLAQNFFMDVDAWQNWWLSQTEFVRSND